MIDVLIDALGADIDNVRSWQLVKNPSNVPVSVLRRERREKLHYVHSASLACEDKSVFMSMAHGTRYGTNAQIRSMDNMKAPMRQHNNHGQNQGGPWL